jgi:hypothetical protein
MYGLRIYCRDVHGGCPFVEVKACGVHGVGANEFFSHCMCAVKLHMQWSVKVRLHHLWTWLASYFVLLHAGFAKQTANSSSASRITPDGVGTSD